MTYDTTNTDKLRESPKIWKLIDRLAKKVKIGTPKFRSTVRPK